MQEGASTQPRKTCKDPARIGSQKSKIVRKSVSSLIKCFADLRLPKHTRRQSANKPATPNLLNKPHRLQASFSKHSVRNYKQSSKLDESFQHVTIVSLWFERFLFSIVILVARNSLAQATTARIVLFKRGTSHSACCGTRRSRKQANLKNWAQVAREGF